MQLENPGNNIAALKAKIQVLGLENSDLKAGFSSLENNFANLQKANKELGSNFSNLQSTHQTLSKKAEWLEVELAMTKHHCQLLKNSIYGKRSEKRKETHSEQMQFLFNEAEVNANLDVIEPAKTTNSSVSLRKTKAGRKALPESLPRVEIAHELEPKDLKCDCGGVLTHIGSDSYEQLDIVPAQVRVNKHIRYKYACKCCQEVVKRATAPFAPLNKSIATSNILAHICTQKFEDHLPLYRQERSWQRLGVNLSRSSMSNWILASGKLLEPLIDTLKQDMIQSDYVISDETVLNVLDNEKSKNYMWLHMSGCREKRAVIYEYQESRSGSCAYEFLEGFKGYHQSDGYSGYDKLHAKEGVVGVGCMAHARRKFMDIVKITNKSGIASSMVNIIGELYKVEKDISTLAPAEIYKIRQNKAKPIIEKLHQNLLQYQDQAPPKSVLGQAIGYCLRQWPKLIAYMEDGRVRIDNNDCERSIKPFVIGRKNWLFCNSTNGAKASSVIYSIIETCKANNINSYNYLRYLFENIHKAKTTNDLRSILPYNLNPQLLA